MHEYARDETWGRIEIVDPIIHEKLLEERIGLDNKEHLSIGECDGDSTENAPGLLRIQFHNVHEGYGAETNGSSQHVGQYACEGQPWRGAHRALDGGSENYQGYSHDKGGHFNN